MNRRRCSVLVLCLGAALSLAALPAAAGDKDKNWKRGCADAKAGTYDRAKHGEAYEKGWQACKKQAPSSTQEDDDYSRGCDDAKAGSYDRAHPTAAYERGWQSCNQKDDSANEGANRQKVRMAPPNQRPTGLRPSQSPANAQVASTASSRSWSVISCAALYP